MCCLRCSSLIVAMQLIVVAEQHASFSVFAPFVYCTATGAILKQLG